MRRSMAVALIAVLVMIVPMAEGAAPAKRYVGTFEPGGTLKFSVKKRNGNRKVVRFKFAGFPVQCTSGSQTHSEVLNFPLPVNRRDRFRAIGVLGNPQNPRARLRLKGKVDGPRKAHGTMQVDGSKLPIDAGGTAACDSPKTKWDASRPQ